MITLLAGLGFGLGLIVAIGAQNAYVLRQGIRREHVGVVVAVCAVSDVLLITVGAAGVGAVIARHATALAVVTVLGAGVLLGYAVLAVRRAIRPAALRDVRRRGPRGPGSARSLLAALALTWLNPHVYLDTVVLLGSVSAALRHPVAVRGRARRSPASAGSPRSASAPGCWPRCSPGPAPGGSSTSASRW